MKNWVLALLFLAGFVVICYVYDYIIEALKTVPAWVSIAIIMLAIILIAYKKHK